MKLVTEKEFVKFIKKYPGKLRPGVDMSTDPPMVAYEDLSTGEIVGRYPEPSLSSKSTYMNMYYEIKD